MSTRSTSHRFVPGFIGSPGRRTFLLEVDDATGRSWYLLEKAQVAALSAQSASLLAQAGLTGAGRDLDPGPISDPEEIAFRIGEIELAYIEGEGVVHVTLAPVDEGVPVLHVLTPAQLDAAARLGKAAVAGGRPLCPKCGLAMDPDGHVCPTTNGDLRDHRP